MLSGDESAQQREHERPTNTTGICQGNDVWVQAGTHISNTWWDLLLQFVTGKMRSTTRHRQRRVFQVRITGLRAYLECGGGWKVIIAVASDKWRRSAW